MNGGKAKIKVEPGVQSGKILRLKSKGLPRIEGYGKGDLLVHINVWTPKNLNSDQKKIDDGENAKGRQFCTKPRKK